MPLPFKLTLLVSQSSLYNTVLSRCLNLSTISNSVCSIKNHSTSTCLANIQQQSIELSIFYYRVIDSKAFYFLLCMEYVSYTHYYIYNTWYTYGCTLHTRYFAHILTSTLTQVQFPLRTTQVFGGSKKNTQPKLTQCLIRSITLRGREGAVRAPKWGSS